MPFISFLKHFDICWGKVLHKCVKKKRNNSQNAQAKVVKIFNGPAWLDRKIKEDIIKKDQQYKKLKACVNEKKRLMKHSSSSINTKYEN